MVPRWYTDDNATTLSEDGVSLIYHMTGRNYDVDPPRSTRLHRLRRFEHLFGLNETYGYRFATNPTLAPHPSFPRDFLLSTQISSASIVRLDVGVFPQDRGFNWAAFPLFSRVRITQRSRDDFDVEYLSTRRPHSVGEPDLRVVAYKPGLTLAHGGWLHGGVHVIDPAKNFAITSSLYPLYHDPLGHANKNWQVILDGDDPIFMAHFCPTTMLTCGPLGPPKAETAEATRSPCSLVAYHNLTTSALPADCPSWRGSHAMLRIPGWERYTVSTTHHKLTDVSPKRPHPRPFYQHRFIVVDTLTLMPVAFSDPFTMLGSLDDVDWFEFANGAAFIGRCDVAITFGYNDSEPWLAIIRFADVVRFLRPAFATAAPFLDALRRQYARVNGC